jgi:hypothetical protein
MKTSKKTGIAVGVAMLALMSQAQDNIWTGDTDNDFNTAGNWSLGAPSGANLINIALSGANVTMSAESANNIHSVYVGGATAGAAPILNISQNLRINDGGNRTLGAGNTGSDTHGVVNHTAGTVSPQRIHISAVGANSGSNRSGTYNFSGGAIDVSSMQIGQFQSDTAVLNLSGTGTVGVSGLVQMNRFGGSSTLNVTGGGVTIDFGGDFTLNQNGSPGSSTINATIDGTGFSTIGVAGDVQFNKTGVVNRTSFNLALGSGYEHTENTTYTILDATGNFTGLGVFGNVSDGQELTVDGNLFRADYVTDGPESQFTITAIPEPATIGLLGIGALITMVVRRRYRV